MAEVFVSLDMQREPYVRTVFDNETGQYEVTVFGNEGKSLSANFKAKTSPEQPGGVYMHSDDSLERLLVAESLANNLFGPTPLNLHFL